MERSRIAKNLLRFLRPKVLKSDGIAIADLDHECFRIQEGQHRENETHSARFDHRTRLQLGRRMFLQP